MLASSRVQPSANVALAKKTKLEPFLLGSPADLPDLTVLKEHRLAAYAYSVLPEAHASRSALQGDFVFASMHHMKLRSSVQPLFKAWAEAGIKVLVFKGFYLAEFLYKTAAQRAYNDIDVLIDPQDSQKASLIAQRLGWLEKWQSEDAEQANNHELVHLEHSSYPIRLDVHGLISHVTGQSKQLQKDLSEKMWQAADLSDWEGTTIYTPSLADSALLGLVTTRSWSTDNWHLKAQDYLDLSTLKEHGLSLKALKLRAKALGCEKTLKLFLQRCNPYREVLDLQEPNFKQKASWEKQIMSERGSPSLIFAFQPTRLQAVLNPLKCKEQDLVKEQLQRLERGVRADLQVTGLARLKTKRLQTLALFVSLRRNGYPVVLRFVRGEYILKFREMPVAAVLNE